MGVKEESVCIDIVRLRPTRWIESRRLDINLPIMDRAFVWLQLRQFLAFQTTHTSFITVTFMYIVRPASELHNRFSAQIFIVRRSLGYLYCPSRSFEVPWLRRCMHASDPSRSCIVPWLQRSRSCFRAPATFRASI